MTIDVDTLEELRDRRDGDDLAEAITLHEFGHLVGIGDRIGLAALGRGRCV